MKWCKCGNASVEKDGDWCDECKVCRSVTVREIAEALQSKIVQGVWTIPLGVSVLEIESTIWKLLGGKGEGNDTNDG